ncbi:MAG: NAD(P)H-hydrate dehydratase [Spirochaetes bacterium]|nr:NAD(P)H-hydrate dehydratase [Spirochaetota bacterium]
MKVCTVGQMRSLDREAVERYAIPEMLLMENASLAVCAVIEKRLGVRGKLFAVFCGIGNNGGDGLAVARKILSEGGIPAVYIAGDPKKFRGAARSNFEIVKSLPVEIEEVHSGKSVARAVSCADAVIDGIFGTGLTREVGGVYRKLIEIINNGGKPVFSIDIPSGIHGDTGKPMGTAVRADHTVTFGAPKLGNILYPGFACCGRLAVSHISFPPPLLLREDLKVEINDPPPPPERKTDGHKGDFGDVLFICGAKHYYGAPYFAALSFLKGGGGYARLALPASMCPHIAALGPEIIFLPQEETASGSIALRNRDDLLTLSEKVDLLVIGCGLSLDDETQTLVRELVRRVRTPVLIDGDGITAISAEKSVILKRRSQTVLTPHPGEMSRITNRGVKEIDENRVAVLQREAADLGAVIVLKGAHTLIGYPDGSVHINLSGNSGMATAGSGDVLAGTIAAMFGLGLPLEEAVRTGVFVHGLSGDLSAKRIGEDGVTARDILDTLPEAVRRYRLQASEMRASYYGCIDTV